jgi:hypothetical protein
MVEIEPESAFPRRLFTVAGGAGDQTKALARTQRIALKCLLGQQLNQPPLTVERKVSHISQEQ